MTLAPHTRLSRYEILAPLGVGGMGEVYRARDTRLEREVAVKVLPESVAADADRLARFEREARALARIEHPNILTIHDFGQEDMAGTARGGVHFAVTELLAGETLGSRLAHERLAWRRAVEIGAAIADGLAAAHGQGIVHRDLKPDNVFLTDDGRVKILDFGLATSGVVASSSAETQLSPGAMTAPGAVVGTVGYMAPEQVHGGVVDGRADLFALGCVLYELVTGRRAFARATPTETVAAILSVPPPEVTATGSDAPAELGRIVTRCLEKQPGARFQSASDLAYALRALLTAPVVVTPGATAMGSGQALAPELPPSPSAGTAIGASQGAVPRPRRARWVLIGTAAAVLVALGVAAFLLLRPKAAGPGPGTSAGTLDPEKVVVAVFANRTGDASLDALGLQISDWVTQRLSGMSVKVGLNPEVPSIGGPGLPQSALGAAPDPIKALAERTGAGLVVTGAYYLEGDGLRVQSQLVDAASGGIAQPLNAAEGARSKPSEVVAGVARVVMGAIAPRLNKALGVSGFRPTTYDAYLEFVRALAATGSDFPEAERRLNRALQLDPDFAGARIQLSMLLSIGSRAAEADRVLRPLEDPGAFSRASTTEQAFVRYARASLDGNLVAARSVAAELVRLREQPVSLYDLGVAEMRLNHPRAAITALSRIRVEDAPAESGPYASWYLSVLAALRHDLGAYDQQLADARLGQQHYPAEGAFFSHEAGALIGLGRLAELDEVIARAEKASLRSGRVGATLSYAADELAAHGHADAAKTMAGRAAAWYKNRLDAGKPTRALQSNYANALLRAGDCVTAVLIRRDLAKQAPDNLVLQSSFATALVACGGSRAEATGIAEALAKVDRPFLRGEHLYQRARILAALGDGDGAVRALQAAFTKGAAWNGADLHLDTCWDPIRTFPAFVEWMKPKG